MTNKDIVKMRTNDLFSKLLLENTLNNRYVVSGNTIYTTAQRKLFDIIEDLCYITTETKSMIDLESIKYSMYRALSIDDYIVYTTLLHYSNIGYQIILSGFGGVGSTIFSFLDEDTRKLLNIYDYDTVEFHNIPRCDPFDFENIMDYKVETIGCYSVASINKSKFNPEANKKYLIIGNTSPDERVKWANMSNIIFCHISHYNDTCYYGINSYTEEVSSVYEETYGKINLDTYHPNIIGGFVKLIKILRRKDKTINFKTKLKEFSILSLQDKIDLGYKIHSIDECIDIVDLNIRDYNNNINSYYIDYIEQKVTLNIDNSRYKIYAVSDMNTYYNKDLFDVEDSIHVSNCIGGIKIIEVEGSIKDIILSAINYNTRLYGVIINYMGELLNPLHPMVVNNVIDIGADKNVKGYIYIFDEEYEECIEGYEDIRHSIKEYTPTNIVDDNTPDGAIIEYLPEGRYIVPQQLAKRNSIMYPYYGYTLYYIYRGYYNYTIFSDSLGNPNCDMDSSENICTGEMPLNSYNGLISHNIANFDSSYTSYTLQPNFYTIIVSYISQSLEIYGDLLH